MTAQPAAPVDGDFHRFERHQPLLVAEGLQIFRRASLGQHRDRQVEVAAGHARNQRSRLFAGQFDLDAAESRRKTLEYRRQVLRRAVLGHATLRYGNTGWR